MNKKKGEATLHRVASRKGVKIPLYSGNLKKIIKNEFIPSTPLFWR
jgi:hypothetical protein